MIARPNYTAAMAMHIPATAEVECVEALADGLASAPRRFRSLLDVHDAADAVAKIVMSTFGRKSPRPPWVSQRLLATFVSDQAELTVETEGLYERGLVLEELDAIREPHATAISIIAALRTLPWSYVIEAPLPLSREALPVSEFTLDPQYSIVMYEHAAAAALPMPQFDVATASRYHRECPDSIAAERPRLSARCVGYIPESDGIDYLDFFVNAWKGLLGLLIVAGAIRPRLLGHRSPPPALPAVLWRTGERQRHSARFRWLDHDDSAAIRLYDVTPFTSSASDARAAIELAAAAFGDAQTRTAARWYFDSVTERNGTLSMVEATVVLEMLLGDRRESDLLGIGSLLANRLAFMTGRTPAQRRSIVADFKRLYDLRCRIVHGGTAELTDDDRTALGQMRDYARSALHAQMTGLSEDAAQRFTSDSSG